jgi:hypothetical protein
MSTRNPLTDPQRDDAFLCYLPTGPSKIYVVRRRAQWVWFGGPDLPIRSARVDHFTETLAMALAQCMNHLSEEQLWPTPKHDDPVIGDLS